MAGQGTVGEPSRYDDEASLIREVEDCIARGGPIGDLEPQHCGGYDEDRKRARPYRLWSRQTAPHNRAAGGVAKWNNPSGGAQKLSLIYRSAATGTYSVARGRLAISSASSRCFRVGL